jgi:predicted peptidase
LVPICGGGDPNTARKLAHVPIWVFHGAKDPVVPVQRSEEMVEALKKANGNVKFTVYPEAGHDSWTEAYNNPELYEWLLQQKQTERKPEGKRRP